MGSRDGDGDGDGDGDEDGATVWPSPVCWSPDMMSQSHNLGINIYSSLWVTNIQIGQLNISLFPWSVTFSQSVGYLPN